MATSRVSLWWAPSCRTDGLAGKDACCAVCFWVAGRLEKVGMEEAPEDWPFALQAPTCSIFGAYVYSAEPITTPHAKVQHVRQ
jgi:hypothetical protein